MYYAAAEALPQYDRFWLIEPDLVFTLDIQALISQLETVDVDFLGASFTEADPLWSWYPAGLRLAPKVYRSLFPISRLSRRAIDHLRQARRDYGTEPEIAVLLRGPHVGQAYANDEAFVSTVLMRDGFDCMAIQSVMPSVLGDTFTSHLPILDVDIGHHPGKVLHPVCDPPRARRKFRGWSNKAAAMPEILAYRQAIIARHGAETWARYCDLDLPEA